MPMFSMLPPSHRFSHAWSSDIFFPVISLIIAVVDLLVVVILDLHVLVAWGEGPAETLDLAISSGVQSRLQFDVERAGANAAAIHRAKHLDVVDRIQAEAATGPRESTTHRARPSVTVCSFRGRRDDVPF